MWLKESPKIEDCPFNVVTFLDSRNILINPGDREEISSDADGVKQMMKTGHMVQEEAIQDAIGCRKWIEKVYQQITQQFI